MPELLPSQRAFRRCGSPTTFSAACETTGSNWGATMDKPRMHECTICGDEKLPGQVWFLVAESHWEDKLRVLEWQDQMAMRQGIYAACSATHVEELVVHWMTTGGLDYPFATVGHKPRSHKRKTTSFLPTIEEPDTRGGRQIGELAVDRECVRRALRDDPESLRVILDELVHALERETTGATARLESADAMSYGFPREI